MILVVGRSSFIAREFLKTSDQVSIVSVRHFELEKIWNISNIDCIVNFAFAPGMYTDAYSPEIDVDRKLGAFAAARGIHYVMMSSRKVYGASVQWNAREEALVTGQDAYGRNKIRVEQILQEMLGSKLTILRPGNVFGFERQPGRTRFGAYLLNQLADNGEIRLTVSAHVRRDLVPVDFFCQVLRKVVAKKPSGIINVGGGQAVEVGQIASSIIEGYGRGKLIADSTNVVDEFQLNSGRLTSELGLTCGVERIEQFSKELGLKLKNEVESNGSRH